MSEWEHKERVWWGLYQYSPLESLDFAKFAEEKAMELATWLDWQCKGGWEVFEIKRSRIFEQAENRMHAQQALLSCLLS